MKQALALNILKTGCNVMLTGMAGAGKTYLLNQYIEYLKSKKIKYAVTASTGIAASHLSGVTIHSWSGIQIKDKLNQGDLERIKAKKEELKDTAVLFIDEISMLHSKQLVLVDQVLKYCRENDNPFGGIQIVVCGDFFQLPPVDDDGIGAAKFCFMSPVWVQADFKICYLTEQYRQKGDVLSDILNQVRNDEITDESISIIKATKNNKLVEPYTRLYTRNINVDSLNDKELDKIDGLMHTYKAVLVGHRALCEMILKQSRLQEVFQYKVGALVMFTKNNSELGYLNGTSGKVVGVTEDEELGLIPIVETLDKRHIIPKVEEWSISDGGEKIATVMQLPLRLAWAITIHKSQGMTLDCAEIDLSDVFELGQGYVALSRLRKLEGMKVIGLHPNALNVTTLIRKVDRRFKELSNELELEVQNKNFKLSHQKFYQHLRDNGFVGVRAKKPRIKFKPIEQKDNPIKGSLKHRNLDEIRKVLKSKVSLDVMAKSRGLTYQTVVSNLRELKKKDKSVSFEYMMPDAEVIAVVAKAIRLHNESGKTISFIKSNSVYIKSQVNKQSKGIRVKIAESEIWEALLFLDDQGQMLV